MAGSGYYSVAIPGLDVPLVFEAVVEDSYATFYLACDTDGFVWSWNGSRYLLSDVRGGEVEDAFIALSRYWCNLAGTAWDESTVAPRTFEQLGAYGGAAIAPDINVSLNLEVTPETMTFPVPASLKPALSGNLLIQARYDGTTVHFSPFVDTSDIDEPKVWVSPQIDGRDPLPVVISPLGFDSYNVVRQAIAADIRNLSGFYQTVIEQDIDTRANPAPEGATPWEWTSTSV